MSSEPVPQRLSDADRDAAVGMLRQHFEAGRLTQPEFDERMGQALAARFAPDVTALFEDLPAPRPAASGTVALSLWAPTSAPQAWTPPGPPATPKAGTHWVRSLSGWVWPLAFVLWIATGSFWWMVGAVVVSIVLGQIGRPPRTPPPQLGP